MFMTSFSFCTDNGEVFMLGGSRHGMLSNPDITTLSKHLSGDP